MASTAFQFVQGNERLDWGVLVAINTERLVKETNVDTLQRVVENLAYARISRDEAALFTPEHIIHLFQLSQVVIQYLVFSQEALARMNIRLNERVVECQQVLEKTDKSRSALEEELQDAQKKVRAQRKTLVAYEYGAAAAGGVRASSPAAGDFHYCPMCGEEYRKRESLQSHMRKRHSSTGPLPTAAAAVEPYQNAPAASIAAYQNPPPPPPPPPTMDAAAVQPSMMSPLPHGGDSCCQHACDVKRLSERVDSLERSLASERALTERLQHDQLMMLLLQSNTQRGGAPVEAQPTAAAVPDHGQRHNIREDSAMRILSTVVTPPAPASVLPPHEAVPTPVNPVSQSAYNVSAIRSALVGADVSSVPVVPDIGASMEYNMTRQREVANNALLRQMAELEDEIRTLKKAPVSAGSASWLAPPPAPPATQPPAVPTVPGQPNAPVNATDATAQLRPTPSYSLQVSPSAHEAVTVPSAVVPTVSVAMPMPSASMSLPMTTAVASAGVLPSPSVALSAPSASMSLPMPSALPLSGPVASPSTALSVPSASMSLPVPAAVPSSGPTSSPSTALSMPSASVPLPTPSAVYPAQSASMSLPVPSTTAPTTSVSMPAPSSSMSLPLSASIVPVVSVSMPQQQRSATPLPMQSSVIPTVSVSMPVPSSNGALPAPTSASMSLPVPAARPSSSMLPVGSMALPVPTSSSLSLSSPTTVPSTIPSPSLALQTTSVALPAQMSVSPPSLGLPAQGTNISQHQSAVAPGASLSIYAPHIPAAVTPIPLTASSASPTVSSQVAHSTSGAPSFFSPTSPVGIDTTASLLTATTPGVPVMSAMAQRASSHDQSSSSSQLLPWDRPLPVPVASISQPAAPVTVVPPVFAQQGHSGQRVQSIVSTTSDQSTTSTQPPYMTGVRSTLPVFGGDATYPRPSTSGADSTASSLTAPGTGTGGVGSYFTSARPIDVPSSASWDRPAPSALPTPASQPSANYANMSYMLGGTAPPSVVPSVVVPTPSPSQGLLQAPQLSPSPSVGMRQSATNSNLAGIAAPSAMKTFRAVSSSSDD